MWWQAAGSTCVPAARDSVRQLSWSRSRGCKASCACLGLDILHLPPGGLSCAPPMLAMTPHWLKSPAELSVRSMLQHATLPFSAPQTELHLLHLLCSLRGPAPGSKVYQRPALSSQQWSKVLAWARSLEVYRLRLQEVGCIHASRGLEAPYVCACPPQLHSGSALRCQGRETEWVCLDAATLAAVSQSVPVLLQQRHEPALLKGQAAAGSPARGGSAPALRRSVSACGAAGVMLESSQSLDWAAAQHQLAQCRQRQQSSAGGPCSWLLSVSACPKYLPALQALQTLQSASCSVQ